MNLLNGTYEELQERIRLLTREREAAKRVLVAAADSLSMSYVVDESFSVDELLSGTAQRLRSFISLDSLVFYLFSPDGLDYSAVYRDPAESLAFFEEEMVPLVEDGTIAWAVDRNKPLIVSAGAFPVVPGERRPERRILLHSIMAPSGSLGIFMGLLGEDESGILDVSFAFATVILSSAAGILQNARFNSTVQELNLELQSKIERLEESERSLAEAIKAKELFLASVSHEVRTPLNGVMGIASILENTQLDSRQRELVGVLKDESQALLGMINDLLDFSKMEAGRLVFENAPFDLRSLWTSVSDSFAARASAKGLVFTMSLDRGVPGPVSGDSLRLRQLLANLVGNAVKFTSSGSVTVTGDVGDGDETRFVLRVRVQDTGIGIPQKEQERLFQPFVQGDASLARRFGGTGLGLAIARRIVEGMGGGISFTSREGKGSTFSFEVPLSRSNEVEQGRNSDFAGATGAPDYGRASALVVEDNPTSRMVAVSLLQQAGIGTVEASVDGEAALELLSRSRYNLIFMDIQMPGINGLEALSIIRDPGSSVLDHDTPVVAMTANVLPGDRERFLAAGMSDYIAKPVQSSELARIARKFLAAGSEMPRDFPRPAIPAAPGPHRHEALLERLGGDPELCDRTLRLFLEDSSELLRKVALALKAGDAEKTNRLFHTLRGASVNVDALRMAELAGRAEIAAEASDLAEAEGLLPLLLEAREEFAAETDTARDQGACPRGADCIIDAQETGGGGVL